MKRRKIAIYGGTFNPVHNGHLKVAQWAINALNIDQLYFVPTFNNPLKTIASAHIVSDQARLAMLNLALIDKTAVSSFDLDTHNIYSINTIKYFQSKYPEAQIYFIIGSDNLLLLDQWDFIDDIVANCQIVCFQRDHIIHDHPHIDHYHVKMLNNPLYQESSTAYRNFKFHIVPPAIQQYIGAHLCYFASFFDWKLLGDWQEQQVNLVNQFFKHYPWSKLEQMVINSLLVAYVCNQKQTNLNSNYLFTWLVNKIIDQYQINTQDQLINQYLELIQNPEKMQNYQIICAFISALIAGKLGDFFAQSPLAYKTLQ